MLVVGVVVKSKSFNVPTTYVVEAPLQKIAGLEEL